MLYVTDMAAFSAVRNRKNQKLREGFEDFLSRCVEKSKHKNEVELDFLLVTLNDSDIKIDQKELTKLDNLANKNRIICRLEKCLSMHFIRVRYVENKPPLLKLFVMHFHEGSPN